MPCSRATAQIECPDLVRERHALGEALGRACAARARRAAATSAPGIGRAGALEEVEIGRGLRLAKASLRCRRAAASCRSTACRCRSAAARPGGARSGQRAGQEFAHQRQARALVLAEGADRALAVAGVAAPSRRAGRKASPDRYSAAVGLDQAALRQRLAALRGDQHLALGDGRGGEVEDDRLRAGRPGNRPRTAPSRSAAPPTPKGATSRLPATLTKCTETSPASAACSAHSPMRPRCPAWRRPRSATPFARSPFAMPSSTAKGPAVWPKP